MNNIELECLKRDLKEHLNYTDEQVENLGVLSDTKLLSMKKNIERVKRKRENTTREKHSKNILEKKINKIFKENPELKEKKIIGRNVSNIKIDKNNQKKIEEEKIETSTTTISIPTTEVKSTPTIKPIVNSIIKPKREFYIKQNKTRKINVPINRKPKILFICDVKGWAWWNKSQYIKKYLGEYFDIDITYVLGNGCTPMNRIDQKAWDLYFSWGHSYISMLYRVPKYKKITGVTAHRPKNVIFPKMKQAGWNHANSILLLKEMYDMGFKNTTWYVPNGIDTHLFRPINPIKESGELIAGHVGKECRVKFQKEIIFPAMKYSGVKSYTNTKNWKNKIPHNQMPSEYMKMSLMMICSSEDGTPNPGLEAMACGRPVITNEIGNMPEIVIDGYNGFIVPKKREAYVEKLNYFKNNRDELIRMGNNARKSVEPWDWKYMSRNYLKMFDYIFDIKRDNSKYENIGLSHLEKI